MMKICPYCAEEIQDQAIKCRYCGEWLDGRAQPARQAMIAYPWGYEYRSDLELFGLPLLHIARGIDPTTGGPHIAKGIIAIGNTAVGGIALGGVALGGFAFGGVSIGLFVFGGLAVGGVAIGGVTLALFLAVGGVALSMAYAIGETALAPHAISALGADPEFVRQLEMLWPGISDAFP